MKRVIGLLLFALALPFFLPIRQVEAAGITGLSVTAMDCVGFTLSDYNAVFDRDNTGTASESIEISVRDSVGTLLWLHTESVALGTYDVPGGSYSYDLASPVNGDLTLTYKSLAGNSLEEQIAFTYTGLCTIPTATPTPTETPTETPTPTATLVASPSPTANYVLRSTIVFGDQSYDVALKLEVTPADYVMVGLGVVTVGLLMMLIFLFIKRGQP